MRCGLPTVRGPGEPGPPPLPASQYLYYCCVGDCLSTCLLTESLEPLALSTPWAGSRLPTATQAPFAIWCDLGTHGNARLAGPGSVLMLQRGCGSQAKSTGPAPVRSAAKEGEKKKKAETETAHVSRYLGTSLTGFPSDGVSRGEAYGAKPSSHSSRTISTLPRGIPCCLRLCTRTAAARLGAGPRPRFSPRSTLRQHHPSAPPDGVVIAYGLAQGTEPMGGEPPTGIARRNGLPSPPALTDTSWTAGH